MKKNLVAILALAATPAFLHAVDSYSEVVGYQTTTLPGNAYKGVGISLVNPAILSGSISSNASGVLTINGQTSIGSKLANDQAYYVELTSNINSLVGNRFDVDVAATITANNGTIVLSGSSVRNTRSDVSTLALTGDSIVLRKHVTFDQIRASILDQTGLIGNDDSPANADALYLYRGAGFVTYWLGSDKASWYTGDDPDDHRFDVIAPGQGILFRKKGSSSATLVSTGSVRNNDYISVLAQGYQLSSPGFPVGYTPVQLGGTIASQANPGGWAVNSQILTYSGAGFAANTLLADGTWDNGVDPDPVNDVVLVNGDNAFMTKLGSQFVGKETKPY